MANRSASHATAAATRVLQQLKKLEPPVPVDKIAKNILRLRVKQVPDPGVHYSRPLAPSVRVAAVLDARTGMVWLRDSHHPHRARFSLAHEIGHLKLHVDAPHPDGFFCREEDISATSGAADPIEIEANAFASELLLPSPLLRRRVDNADVQLSLVLELAREFGVSPECMAIRIARAAWQPYAMIVSSEGKVEFSFCSPAMRQLTCYTFVRKGDIVDRCTETAKYFQSPERVAAKHQSSHDVDPTRWFADCRDDNYLIEEVAGLGHGRVLTILSQDYTQQSTDDDDEDY